MSTLETADVAQTSRKIKYMRVFYFTFDTLIQFVSLYLAQGIGEEFCPYNCYFEFKISIFIYRHPSPIRTKHFHKYLRVLIFATLKTDVNLHIYKDVITHHDS